MNLSQIAAAATSNTTPEEGTFSLPKAIVGALAGALVVGLIYGVVGRFVNEYAYLAVLIGSASGLGAVRLNRATIIARGQIMRQIDHKAGIAPRRAIADPRGIQNDDGVIGAQLGQPPCRRQSGKAGPD